MENNEYIEKVRLKTIFVMLKRRLLLWLIPFLLFSTFGLIYSKKIYKPVYQTSAIVDFHYDVFTWTHTSNVYNSMTNEIVLENTVKKLNEKNISTTEEVLKNGVIFPETTNSYYLTLKFNATNHEIIQEVFLSLIDETILYMQQRTELFGNMYNSLEIYSTPQEISKISNENMYFYLCSFLGLAIGITLAYIKETTLDQIYDLDDITLINKRVVQITLPVKKKKTFAWLDKTHKTNTTNNDFDLSDNFTRGKTIYLTAPKIEKHSSELMSYIWNKSISKNIFVLYLCNKEDCISFNNNEMFESLSGHIQVLNTNEIKVEEIELLISQAKEKFDSIIVVMPPIDLFPSFLSIMKKDDILLIADKKNETKRETIFTANEIVKDNILNYINVFMK